MTTPTETGYLRYAAIDGKTFIVDADGRVLAQCVPVEPNTRMLRIGMERGARGIYNEGIFVAMLSAAQVDLTGAVVKVPEKIEIWESK